MRTPASDDPCPCGSGDGFAGCCQPLLAGTQRAATPEALMRSRYTAFAVGSVEHLLRTWHPSTRPDELHHDGRRRWTRLRVLRTLGGGPNDDTGVVEFRAHYLEKPSQGIQTGVQPERGVQHEVSRFVCENGVWFYLDGDPRA